MFTARLREINGADYDFPAKVSLSHVLLFFR